MRIKEIQTHGCMIHCNRLLVSLLGALLCVVLTAGCGSDATNKTTPSDAKQHPLKVSTYTILADANAQSVELAGSQKLLIQAESGVEMAKAQFNTILRRDINTPVALEDILSMPPFDTTPENCFTTAVQERPEIKTAGIKVRQAEHLLAIEKSQYYPNVGVVGHYERFGDSTSLKGSDFKDQEGWYVAAVANWNFWEWGKTRDRVQAQKAYGKAAGYGRDMLLDQIRLEVKQAYLGLQDARKQFEVAEKAVKQAEENYRINVANYQEQMATNTDVLDAQTLLIKTRTDLVNAQDDYQINLAGLERVMGKVNTQ